MSAVKVVRYLLANNAAFTAVAPAARVVAGILAEGTVAPAAAITHVSTVRPRVVGDEPLRFATSRVQVTAVAANYPQLRQLVDLARAAVPRRPGTVNGVAVDSIDLESEGPDFADESGLHMASLDFIVRWTE